MTKKDVIKNLIFVAIMASLIFVIQVLMMRIPYVGIGDYFDQQIAFYTHAHDFITDGNWLWDWNSELGAEFIPTFAFYLTFSPFFLITLLFPVEWMVCEMPILIVLKIVLADGMALLYFKDKFKKKELAFLGAFLYAFCGWMFDSLFFNHFIEVMAIFPLYLWSFDEVMAGRRKGLFCILTTASILINYFFWFGEVIFIALYFVIRKVFDKTYDVKLGGFTSFVIEGLIGVALTGVVLLPIMNTVFQNPRAIAKLAGDTFTYENPQMYFSIIESALSFPTIMLWKGDWFKILKFGCPSQTLYILGLGVFLIPLFFAKAKERWMKIFLSTLTIIALVPILNSSFALFSSTYYCRWFYMFTFFLIWTSLLLLDQIEIEKERKNILISTSIVIVVYIVCAIAGYFLNAKDNPYAYWVNIWFSIITFAISVMAFIFCILEKDTKKMVVKTIVISSVLMLSFYSSIRYVKMVEEETEVTKGKYLLTLMENDVSDDSEFYRIYNEDYMNTGLLHNKSSMLGYNSITPASVYDFYKLLNEDREVQSDFIEPDSKLLSLFSTKYFYVGHKWVENEEYMPMGIVFNNLEPVLNYNELIVSETDIINKLYLESNYYHQFKHLDVEIEEDALVNELVIDDINIKINHFDGKREYIYTSNKNIEIPDICKNTTYIKINDKPIGLSNEGACIGNNLFINKTGDVKIEVGWQELSDLNIYSANLENMVFDQYGFEADINLDKEALVFFTIPYDSLWDAYIDGEQVEIIKGDNAFIVLHVKEGPHHIEIKYNTKYYEYGAMITIPSILILAAYMIVSRKKKSIKSS